MQFFIERNKADDALSGDGYFIRQQVKGDAVVCGHLERTAIEKFFPDAKVPPGGKVLVELTIERLK